MDIFDKNNFEQLRKYGLGNVQVTTTNKNFDCSIESDWSVEPNTFEVSFNLDEVGLHRLQEALYMWLTRYDSGEEKKMYEGEPNEEKIWDADECVAEDDFVAEDDTKCCCFHDDYEFACEPSDYKYHRYKIIHR